MDRRTRRLLTLVALVGSCAHRAPVVPVEPAPEHYNVPDEAKDVDAVCVRTEAGASWRLCITVGNLKHVLVESRRLPNHAKAEP